MLKSRYSGEWQAEKHRAELQIRRRKPNESLLEPQQDIRRLMALAYPKLTAEAREEIACDHFTNALSDPDFALKVKERAPTLLDEALRIALRLEASTKSTKLTNYEEDRTDRTKQKVRAVGKQDGPKASSSLDSNERFTKIEKEVTKITTDMNKQYEELKRLITQYQQKPRTSRDSAEQAAASGNSLPVSSRQRPKTQASGSAGECSMPVTRQTGNDVRAPVQQTAQPQAFPCWGCGMSGHLRRNCPM